MPKIAVIIYSTYGHITELAKKEVQGLRSVPGIDVDIYQIQETLSDEVLELIHAPPKPDLPIIKVEDLPKYDGFLFGMPTRYGTFPAQFKTFWDATGGLWAKGELHGKYVGQFVSTALPGGGQEVTVRNTLSSFAHHGLIYVPLGYGEAFPLLTNLDEAHGGSPWGAGALAASDGSRKPSKLELDMAELQGKIFGKTVARAVGPTKSQNTAAGATAGTSGAAAKETGNRGVSGAQSASKAAENRAAQSTTTPAAETKSESGCCGVSCVVM